jgi:hypothetical protein
MRPVAFAFALVAPILATLGGCATPAPAGSSPSLSFVVIGDTPYDEEDRRMLLDEALPRIRDMAAEGAAPFVIHIGDYKGGGAECTAELDDAFERLRASLAPTPVLYTPGDNEWTDCDRRTDPATGKPYSELQRLALVRQRFLAKPPAGVGGLSYSRQRNFPEHQTWRASGVRFATLHAVGTENGRSFVTGVSDAEGLAEVEAREAAALAWLNRAATAAKRERARALVIAMQADPVAAHDDKTAGSPCTGVSRERNPCDAFIQLRAALKAAAATFGGPVLLIHGDTDPFTLNQDLMESGSPNLWRLNAAGDAGVGSTGQRYGVRDVTRVTIDPAATPPFAAVGLATGKAPAEK